MKLVVSIHGHHGIVDIEELGAFDPLIMTNDQRLLIQRIDEMRKAIWKARYLFGVANGPDDINAETLNDLLRSLRIVNDDDGIETSAPEGVRETKDLP